MPPQGSTYPMGVPKRSSCRGGGLWRWRAQCQGPCEAHASGGAGSWHKQHCKECFLPTLCVKWLRCRLVWSHSIFMSAVPAAGHSLADLITLWF